MIGWRWLTDAKYSWGFVLRVILKAAAIFIMINVLFALFNPMTLINQVSLYNGLVPGRERLPYGEQSEAYNLSLDSIEAMFASHEISRPKADDEMRVVLIGDSSVWGVLLENDQTLTGQMNATDLVMADAHYAFYNLGYPTLSVLKDLLILQEAMQYEPDVILWLVTLDSLYTETLLDSPLVQRNPWRVRALIEQYDLAIDPADERFIEEGDFLDQALVGQRRQIADWWRLQLYGIPWALTGKDQVMNEYDPLTNDFSEDVTWQGVSPDEDIEDVLALDVLRAGQQIAGDVPLLVVNEPIFIADGENSDLHYNFWYPRWAYDAYESLMRARASEFADAYTAPLGMIAPEHFTDSPVHMDPEGTARFARAIRGWMLGVLYP